MLGSLLSFGTRFVAVFAGLSFLAACPAGFVKSTVPPAAEPGLYRHYGDSCVRGANDETTLFEAEKLSVLALVKTIGFTVEVSNEYEVRRAPAAGSRLMVRRARTGEQFTVLAPRIGAWREGDSTCVRTAIDEVAWKHMQRQRWGVTLLVFRCQVAGPWPELCSGRMEQAVRDRLTKADVRLHPTTVFLPEGIRITGRDVLWLQENYGAASLLRVTLDRARYAVEERGFYYADTDLSAAFFGLDGVQTSSHESVVEGAFPAMAGGVPRRPPEAVQVSLNNAVGELEREIKRWRIPRVAAPSGTWKPPPLDRNVGKTVVAYECSAPKGLAALCGPGTHKAIRAAVSNAGFAQSPHVVSMPDGAGGVPGDLAVRIGEGQGARSVIYVSLEPSFEAALGAGKHTIWQGRVSVSVELINVERAEVAPRCQHRIDIDGYQDAQDRDRPYQESRAVENAIARGATWLRRYLEWCLPWAAEAMKR